MSDTTRSMHIFSSESADVGWPRSDAADDQRYQQFPAVTARELVMLRVMNEITDEPKWRKNLASILAAKKLTEKSPLMSHKAWEWCLSELTDKVDEPVLRVLEAGSCVCKAELAVQLNGLQYTGEGFLKSAVDTIEGGRLPCDVIKGRITSSIAGLPAELYSDLEKIIAAAVPMWEASLMVKGARYPLRIHTYGVGVGTECARDVCQAQEILGTKSAALPEVEGGSMSATPLISNDYDPEWKHPEPGSYHEWKAGRHCYVVEPKEPHEFARRYDVVLEDIQVIVQISSTGEWTSRWHLEELEPIVGSLMYVLEGSGSVSFRQETPIQFSTYHTPAGQSGHACDAFTQLYGFEYLDFTPCHFGDLRSMQFQRLGVVQLQPGRLVTWPNTLEYKLSAKGLKYVLIHLVDPQQRILSTSLRDALTRVLREKLPQELVDQIMEEDVDRAGLSERVEKMRRERYGKVGWYWWEHDTASDDEDEFWE